MLTPASIIRKKRDSEILTDEEIRWFVRGLTSGEVADYQATALLMAVYLRGMSPNETVSLTRAMLESGEHYDLSHIPGPKVDKHSTGGVGDKVSLILAPLAAACGLKVPMMAGRGLGHSGGTLDKLESIRGFNVRIGRKRFEEILAKVGCAIIGQTDQIAPADKRLYALRDVTATVDCIPLIVASILSKKLAEGTDGLILDVKVGNGAFMRTGAQARKLARELIRVAKKLGLNCRAVLTDMNQPLGYSAGNALEVRECVEIMSGQRFTDGDPSSSDLREVTLRLCAQMLEMGGIAKNLTEARKIANRKLEDGSAWKVFQQMIEEQGGDVGQVVDPLKLPQAPSVLSWSPAKKGYITRINTTEIGNLLIEMGGGRRKASDEVDPSVGLIFHRKLGAKVQPGEPIVTVHAPKAAPETLQAWEQRFLNAITISPSRKPVPKLILDPCLK